MKTPHFNMNHGSLFSGLGGFDLAAEWAGWNNLFHCEINPFGQKILKYYWPKAISYEDITKTDFSIWRGKLDILTGGFPCQPYSITGKRLGKEDDRHLWPEMLRAVRESQPGYVVGENVRGLTNWSGGLVFDEVQADLESEGYEVLPFLLPACGVNAPHRRDRIWFIAYSKSKQSEQLQSKFGKVSQPKQGQFRGNSRAMGYKRTGWGGFPTQPPVCSGDDGLPPELDGITLQDWRSESIKAAGNAIVPQVAYEIFKAINEYETRNH